MYSQDRVVDPVAQPVALAQRIGGDGELAQRQRLARAEPEEAGHRRVRLHDPLGERVETIDERRFDPLPVVQRLAGCGQGPDPDPQGPVTRLPHHL